VTTEAEGEASRRFAATGNMTNGVGASLGTPNAGDKAADGVKNLGDEAVGGGAAVMMAILPGAWTTRWRSHPWQTYDGAWCRWH
jgi:hypothetical protein